MTTPRKKRGDDNNSTNHSHKRPRSSDDPVDKGAAGWIEDLFSNRKKERQQKQADADESDTKRKSAQLPKSRSSGRSDESRGEKKQKYLGSPEDKRVIDTLDPNEWRDDGLGGVFDREGFTGRKSQEGFKIFKKHLLNKKNSGNTPLCPFDCDCCFI